MLLPRAGKPFSSVLGEGVVNEAHEVHASGGVRVELLGCGLTFLVGADDQTAFEEETALAQAVDESPENETIGDNGEHRQRK